MKYRYPLCWRSPFDSKGNQLPVPEVRWEPIEIDVQEVSSRQAPVVLETPDIKIRWYDSSHWYPFTASTDKFLPETRGKSHKEALHTASETGDYSEVLTLKKNPLVSLCFWTQGASSATTGLGSQRTPPRKVLPGFEKKDAGRDDAVAEMKKAARNTIMIDGFIWTRGGPPVLAAWRRMPELTKTGTINFVIDDIDNLCGETNQKYYRKDWMMFSPQTPARDVMVEVKRQWPDLRGKNLSIPPIKVFQPETLRKNIELIELKSQVAAAIGEWWGSSVLNQASNEDPNAIPDWRMIDNNSISMLLDLKEALENTHRDPSEQNIISLEIQTDAFVREAYPKGSLSANYLSNALDRWMARPENVARHHSVAS